MLMFFIVTTSAAELMTITNSHGQFLPLSDVVVDITFTLNFAGTKTATVRSNYVPHELAFENRALQCVDATGATIFT